MTDVAVKRRLRADDRRALIVEAALEQFGELGYDAASMGEIARRAGVTRTVLYDHFESKRALFTALVEDKHEELLAQQRAVIGGDAPIAERLGAAVDALYAFAEREPLAWQLLFPDRAPLPPEVADDHRRLSAKANRLTAELLEADARRLGLDPAHPESEAIFALQRAAMNAAVRWWHRHPEVTREQLVQATMDTIWTGMSGLMRGQRWPD